MAKEPARPRSSKGVWWAMNTQKLVMAACAALLLSVLASSQLPGRTLPMEDGQASVQSEPRETPATATTTDGVSEDDSCAGVAPDISNSACHNTTTAGVTVCRVDDREVFVFDAFFDADVAAYLRDSMLQRWRDGVWRYASNDGGGNAKVLRASDEAARLQLRRAAGHFSYAKWELPRNDSLHGDMTRFMQSGPVMNRLSRITASRQLQPQLTCVSGRRAVCFLRVCAVARSQSRTNTQRSVRDALRRR